MTSTEAPTAAEVAMIAVDSAELAKCLSPAARLLPGEPLAPRTTLRVGGPAELLVEPASEGDLAETLRYCRERGLAWMLLGRGSNLLVRDGGVRGVVIHLCHDAFSRIDPREGSLQCGAGARLRQVAAAARQAAMGGFEFLEGIPGSVGGALRMNAGAMGSAMFDLVESVRIMDSDGKVTELPASQITVDYRKCLLLKSHIALGARLRGRPAEPGAIRERMKVYSEKRWSSQPAASSAGCIFKNPASCPAGRLIDELGLKGLRVGAAVVSATHANFIVNEGGASARDVLELIELIRGRARAGRGIELETEVEIVGEDPGSS
jgi:UDP-N-acetylenolpyruvoylglucosamine reductase